MDTVQLTEAAAELAPTGAPQRQADGTLKFRARLIAGDAWGSKAYYPAEVIKRDGPTVWKAGTLMYADHPTQTEQYDRQERSIRDVAGTIASTPVYESAAPAGLYADVRVNAAAADLIGAMWQEIGLSVRCDAEVDTGTVAGRSGRIVKRLVETAATTSVDFVTKAGAGGQLISLMESHRAAEEVPRTALAEALPGGLTFDDLRTTLRELVRSAFADVRAYAEVADFTDEHVIFTVVDYSSNGPSATWQQTYAATDSGGLEFTGEPVQVRQRTEYTVVPADDPAAATLPTSPRTTTVVGSEAATVAESTTATAGGTPVGTVNIEESEHRALLADRVRISVAESERDAARAELARRDAVDVARPLATTLLAESATLPAGWQTECISEALTSVPLTSDNRLDETAFRARVGEIRAREERKHASLAESAGAGTVTGLGGGTAPAGASTANASGGAGGSGTVELTESAARDQILAMRGKKKSA